MTARPAVAAEETHLFNATLSLTGDCSTSTADPVQDPSCPAGPPLGSFDHPEGVSTDAYGDIFVVSHSTNVHHEEEGKFFDTHELARVDVFDPIGHFITEVAVPDATVVAVDSTGHLYVCRNGGTGYHESDLLRFDPTEYDPQARQIEYATAPVTVTEIKSGYGHFGIAIDPADDHLLILGNGDKFGNGVAEYGSAAEGNKLLATGELPGTFNTGGLAVDWTRGLLYLAATKEANSGTGSKVVVFEDQPPFAPVGTIDGSSIPVSHQFTDQGARLAIAANEANGHVFVKDQNAKSVYEFEADGSFVATLNKPALQPEVEEIAFDNSSGSPSQGYLYVPSGASGHDHLYAFEPVHESKPPLVEAVSAAAIGHSEAVLQAKINPQGTATTYTFEYLTQKAYEEGGESFASATLAGSGTLPASGEGLTVSAPAEGLSAGSAYRFRVRAQSPCEPEGCGDEAQGTFATFPSVAQSGECANQSLRTGAASFLPDCRAYELVTPPDTHGRPPQGPTAAAGGSAKFATPTASPDGNSLAYLVTGGPLPGMQGAGGFQGDVYTAARTAAGWASSNAGPSGAESTNPSVGGLSPDHGYSSFTAQGINGAGSLVLGDQDRTTYIRYPDGSYHLVGQGSLGLAQEASPKFIAPGATHIIFGTFYEATAVQLEPQAPPDGTRAIYDRTPDGVLHVVSLLPGDETPEAGQNARYEGSSADGSAVAFRLGDTQASTEASPFYLRLDDAETLVAAPPGSTFAGLSVEGSYLFYVQGGDLFRFDVAAEAASQISESHDVTLVDIPSSGAGAYFLSPSLLASAANPRGAFAAAGEPNLYYWDGGSIRFVATVTVQDEKELGVWLRALEEERGGTIALSSDSGATLVFGSRANLTGYESGGYREMYRYDAGEEALACLSCDATGLPAGSDALLQDGRSGVFGGEGADGFSVVPNLSDDGRRVFFSTKERLAPADNDGAFDVYEWEAEGKGSCASAGGCLFLISSGSSAGDNLLFGVSSSGDDVFIETPDRLLPGTDADETPSVYDARVGGGFAPPQLPPGECLGEACQPAAVAPNDPTPASSAFEGAGNLSEACPKGRRRAPRSGSARCQEQRKHKKHKRQHKKQQKHLHGRAAR